MDGTDLMILITVGSGFTATLCLFICIVLSFKLRSSNRRAAALASRVEDRLEAFSRDIEAVSKQVADQGRRTAWLESRVRRGAQPARHDDGQETAAPAKPTMTERRYRVLSLARKGMDTNAIAALLGEPHGEIELIIGLNNAA